MRFVTDLADQAVMLPLIVVIAVMLAMQGWRRGASAWLAAAALTFGAMLVVKLVFLGCGGALAITHISSPSGHAASAALVGGGLLALFVFSLPATLSAAIAGATLIGYTRVKLGAHSVEEAILGGVIGTAGAVVLARLAGPPPPPRVLPLAIVIAVILVGLHGTRLPAEAAVRQVSTLFHLILPWCDPVRSAWHPAPPPCRIRS